MAERVSLSAIFAWPAADRRIQIRQIARLLLQFAAAGLATGAEPPDGEVGPLRSQLTVASACSATRWAGVGRGFAPFSRRSVRNDLNDRCNGQDSVSGRAASDDGCDPQRGRDTLGQGTQVDHVTIIVTSGERARVGVDRQVVRPVVFDEERRVSATVSRTARPVSADHCAPVGFANVGCA